MKSTDEVTIPGVYRTSCCGHEVTMERSHPLPPCPSCRSATTWALVRRFDLQDEHAHSSRSAGDEIV